MPVRTFFVFFELLNKKTHSLRIKQETIKERSLKAAVQRVNARLKALREDTGEQVKVDTFARNPYVNFDRKNKAGIKRLLAAVHPVPHKYRYDKRKRRFN